MEHKGVGAGARLAFLAETRISHSRTTVGTALSSAKCRFRRRGVQGAEWAGAAVREIVG